MVQLYLRLRAESHRTPSIVRALRSVSMDAQLERGFRRIYQEASDPDALFVNEKFRLLRDSHGEPQYIVGLTEDITERRRAEKALAQRETLFRSIFEHAQIGISIFEIDAQTHLTNRTLQEMLGCSEEELRGLEQWNEIVHPDVRESSAKRYAALIHGERVQDEVEHRFVRRDGRVVVS